MSLASFLILQIIAHLLTDFTFQNNRLALDKNSKGFKSKFLVWHALIALLLSFILSFQPSFIVGAIIIGVTHYVIDGCKVYLNRSKIFGKYAYFLDQFLHIAVIVAVTLVFHKIVSIEPLFELDTFEAALPYILGFLFILKPSNIFIREMLVTFNIQTTPQENELDNAGRLIGILERILTVIFMLIGQFTAIGFLIAAKSILRYKDTDLLKTEYVLIGTMLSFGLAVIVGILIGLF